MLLFEDKNTEMKDFRKKYNDVSKWIVKQAGRVMQEQDNYDEDELYGLAVTATKKCMDLAEASLDVTEKQFDLIVEISNKLNEERKEREFAQKQFEKCMDKLEKINDRLERIEKKSK